MLRLFPIVLLALAAGGCATGGDFPSLAPRPVERLSMEEAVRVDPQVAPDPALGGRAGALLAQARQGDQAFETEFARALPVVRRAGASGSDSWIEAQEMISRVEAARVGSTSALAELDLLISARSDDPTNDAQWADLIRSREAAEAIVADQRRRIDGLKASVSRP
jgi:hypothetical protein